MELFLESFPKIFISGIVMTLPLALVSFIIAMLIAIVCAMIQYAKVPIAKNIVQFYIWIFRGTPMLVQLFIMYFGMLSIKWFKMTIKIGCTAIGNLLINTLVTPLNIKRKTNKQRNSLSFI